MLQRVQRQLREIGIGVRLEWLVNGIPDPNANASELNHASNREGGTSASVHAFNNNGIQVFDGISLPTSTATATVDDKIARLAYDVFLLSNLHDIGEPILPKDITSWHNKPLPGQYCLQVDEVVDICHPLHSNDAEDEDDEETRQHTAPRNKSLRCLKLVCTDGVIHVCALEWQRCPELVPKKFGFKIAVRNVYIRQGCLMLTPSTMKVLGGVVKKEDIVNSMQRKQALLKPGVASREIPQTHLAQPQMAQPQPPQRRISQPQIPSPQIDQSQIPLAHQQIVQSQISHPRFQQSQIPLPHIVQSHIPPTERSPVQKQATYTIYPSSPISVSPEFPSFSIPVEDANDHITFSPSPPKRFSVDDIASILNIIKNYFETAPSAPTANLIENKRISTLMHQTCIQSNIPFFFLTFMDGLPKNRPFLFYCHSTTVAIHSYNRARFILDLFIDDGTRCTLVEIHPFLLERIFGCPASFLLSNSDEEAIRKPQVESSLRDLEGIFLIYIDPQVPSKPFLLDYRNFHESDIDMINRMTDPNA